MYDLLMLSGLLVCLVLCAIGYSVAKNTERENADLKRRLNTNRSEDHGDDAYSYAYAATPDYLRRLR